MKWPMRGQPVERPANPTRLPAAPREKTGHFVKPRCFDCGSTTRKLKQVPGTKTMVGCAECIRKRRDERRLQGRERRQGKVYGITLAEEALIVEFQGGACICAKWTGYNGNSRSLSTDHDHKTGEVRGKLCKHCNDLLGRIKDDPGYFRRMIAYLENPPAKRVLGSRIVPGHEPSNGSATPGSAQGGE